MSFDSNRQWAERPLGMRDVYPKQAKHRRQVESRLLALCERHEFEMVSCGAFEYVDTLLRGRALSEAEEWIRLFDTSGRTVALRPELTPSIARMAAPLIRSGHTDIRWCYAERVYHRTDDPASLSLASGRAAESTQVGVEWIGREGAGVDASTLQILYDGLMALDLSSVQVVVSHAEFTPAYLAAMGLGPAAVSEGMAALVRGDYVGFRSMLAAKVSQADVLGTDNARTDDAPFTGDSGAEPFGNWDVLRQLSSLNPLSPESLPNELRRVWRDSEAGQLVLSIWESLVDFGEALRSYEVCNHVVFDLTLARDLSYYTGVVFEAFVPGVGAPVALGGRYDGLLEQFGAHAPAIGFAYEVERLLGAMTEGLWVKGTVPSQGGQKTC